MYYFSCEKLGISRACSVCNKYLEKKIAYLLMQLALDCEPRPHQILGHFDLKHIVLNV
jgi:hypothetical protein